MKNIFLLTLIAIGFDIGAQSVFVPVKIAETPDNEPPRHYCEPTIAINPTNPANIAAGCIMDRYFYSEDSGKTWQEGVLKSQFGVWGDPVIVADAKGRFYFFHLSDPDGTNWDSPNILDRIVCQRSDDGGKSYTAVDSYMGLNPPKQQDKEWAAVDGRNGNVYASWTQFDKYGSDDPKHRSNIVFSRSEDGGETWSEAVQINELSGYCLDNDTTTEGAVPAVGPRGEVYVAWAFDEKIYLNKSRDGGRTWWPHNVEVADQIGGWRMEIDSLKRANGFPITAVDVSDGPFRGSVYVAWADKRNGPKNSDIFISRSLDGGKSFGLPIRVNADETETEQFFPWLAVDPVTGYLYMVFYDRSLFDDHRTTVTLATSKDGGVTWVNERITQTPFAPSKTIFFGDYNNISVYNGVIRPIWTEFKNGKLSIWTALIKQDF